MFDESSWVNRVITAGIIGMIGWTLLTVNDLSTRVAVMQAELLNLRSTIASSAADRYTRSEAVADRALLEQRITRLEEWNSRLSERVNETEEVIARQEAHLDNIDRFLLEEDYSGRQRDNLE